VALDVSPAARRRLRIRQDLPTAHPPVFDEIEALLAQVPDPVDLGSEEVVGSITAVAGLRNRLDAILTGLAGEADTRKLGQVFAAGTTGTLIAAATGTDPAAGSAQVLDARALRDMPYVAAAYRDGLICGRHVHALREAAGRITGFADIEEGLAGLAAQIEPAQLRRYLDILIAQCLPEDPDHDLAAQRAKRGVGLSELPNGLFRLSGYLDGIEGQRLRDALLAFSERGGPDDTRDPAQRRADALADLVSVAQAATRPLGVSGLTVLIDLEQLPAGLTAHLEDGKTLGPQAFERLSCTVALACLFGVKRSGTFVPLAMGRAARRATAGQWAALIARDRGCIRCGKTPRGCEAHHIVHWKDGGLTDISNMVLLCSRCHHDLHAGVYTVTMNPDGIPIITVNRGPPLSHTG
jgi:hypothetical protein